MENQITNTILMVEPIAFGYNEQTAVNNYFQQNDNSNTINIQNQALSEFLKMVDKLKSIKIDVIVVKDTTESSKPDSIFPNNWISFHQDGRVALYPMFAGNRRLERRRDILDLATKRGFEIRSIIDYTSWENKNVFLEGTGSMILDRQNRIAYAALSERTDKGLLLEFCKDFAYIPVWFSAFHNSNGNRLPIYHTNVMMCVAEQYSVICLESIDNREERKLVVDSIEKTGKEIIEITQKQIKQFAGNMLQLENADNQKFVIMSTSAYDSLSQKQIRRLEHYNEIVAVNIATIEKYGGGSVRCMIAEIFKH